MKNPQRTRSRIGEKRKLLIFFETSYNETREKFFRKNDIIVDNNSAH